VAPVISPQGLVGHEQLVTGAPDGGQQVGGAVCVEVAQVTTCLGRSVVAAGRTSAVTSAASSVATDHSLSWQRPILLSKLKKAKFG